MAFYSDKYKGYVADVADIDFIRCDGKAYSCKEATATSITPAGDALQVTGGQGSFPLAYIDSGKSLDLSFTNAAFDMDMFELFGTDAAYDASAAAPVAIFTTERVTVASGNTVTLSHTPITTKTMYANGIVYGTTAGAGKFTVSGSTLTFTAGDVEIGKDIDVNYYYNVEEAHVVPNKTNSQSARGEVWFHIPVYSSGTNCAESAIKGWVDIHVYRVRVTTNAPVDTSYKSAATFQVQFSAIDPKRVDKLMYEVHYRAA